MNRNQAMRKTYAFRNRNVSALIAGGEDNSYRRIPTEAVSAVVVRLDQPDRIHELHFSDGSQLHIGYSRQGYLRRIIHTFENVRVTDTLYPVGQGPNTSWHTKKPDYAHVLPTDRISTLVSDQLVRSNQLHTIHRLEKANKAMIAQLEKGNQQKKLLEKVANDRGLVIQQLTQAYHNELQSRMVLTEMLERLAADTAFGPLLKRMYTDNTFMTSFFSACTSAAAKAGKSSRLAKDLFAAAQGDSRANGCTAMDDAIKELNTKPKGFNVDAPWSSPEYRSDGWTRHPAHLGHVYKGMTVLTIVEYKQRFGKDFN